MSLRLQLVIITLTAFLCFAGLIFRSSLGVVDQGLRRQTPAGAAISEGPARWMAEHLAKRQRELTVQLRHLVEGRRPANTAEFAYWGVLERAPFGFRFQKSLGKSAPTVPAKILEAWQEGLPAKPLEGRDNAWAVIQTDAAKYLMFSFKEPGAGAGAVVSGLLPAHWMSEELNLYFSGRYQMSVLDQDGKVYFSPQLDLIGENGQVVSWIQGWFKGGRPETLDLKSEGGSFLRVQALAVPGASLHVVLAEALPGLQAIFGWKMSFVMLTLAFMAFLWGGIGFIVTPINKALAELSLMTRDLVLGTRRVAADRDHAGLFASIFQNLARIQARLQEPVREAPKETVREVSKGEPADAARAVLPVPESILEPQPPSVLPSRGLVEEFFDTAVVSLGALQAAKNYAPEEEKRKLEEAEAQLRRLKEKAGSFMGGAAEEESEEFDFARRLPSDNLLQKRPLDDSFLESTSSQIDFLEIADDAIEEASGKTLEEPEGELKEESTSTGDFDFFVRKPRIKDE